MGAALSLSLTRCPSESLTPCPFESLSRVASPELCDKETWANTVLNRGSLCPADRLCDAAAWWRGLEHVVTGLVRGESCDSIEMEKLECALNMLSEAPMLVEEGGLEKRRVGFGKGEVVFFNSEMPAAELFR